MTNKNNHITKLTPALIDQYQKGELSEQEQYQVELLMLNSPFEKEAAEGFESYDGDMLSDLVELNSTIEKRINEEKNDSKFFWFKIAASALILALSSYLIWDLSQSESLEPHVVAENENITPEIADAQPQSIDTIEKKKIESKPEFIAENKSKEESQPKRIVETKTEIIEERQKNNREASPVSDASSINALAYEPLEDNDDLESSKIEAETSVNRMLEELSPAPSSVADVGIVAEREESNQMAESRRSAKKSKAATDYQSSDIFINENSITGKVTSAEDGSPLSGISVSIKGTALETITDLDGNYKIDGLDPLESNTLIFSQFGLTSKEVGIGTKSELDIQMSADIKQLSEVVVSRSNTNNLSGIYKFAQPTIGINAYKKYLSENIKYPQDSTIESGSVIVTFDVKEDGSLENYNIKRGLSEWHNNEAIRLIKDGSGWSPSTNDGIPEIGNVKVVVKFISK